MLNWDDLRIFLSVGREGGFVGAARKLKLDHTTVARRVGALESATGAQLLHRSPRGARLTEAGTELMERAERIEAEVLSAGERLGATNNQPVGVVRLATPEAFGTWLVAPNIGELHGLHPGIQLELVPASRALNLSKREADIGVALSRPTDPRLITRKLFDYRLGLYASRDYLDGAPAITDIGQLRQHSLISYIDEFVDVPELKYLEQLASTAPTIFRSTSVVAQQAAIASGLGIGVLHSFAAEKDPGLVPILPESVSIERTYWLILHADQRQISRMRAVADFLDRLKRKLEPRAT